MTQDPWVSMRIQIFSPRSPLAKVGNEHTSGQWAGILRSLGHEVWVTDPDASLRPADVMVALHAVKCHAAIVAHSRQYPHTPRIVALAGTDLYGGERAKLNQSLALADSLVVLQEMALARLPEEARGRARVIIQTVASPPRESRSQGRALDPFDVCVVGHLRAVKDPMRAAIASRELPECSRIRIRHAGAILDESYRELVHREAKENPRYTWLGELDGERVWNLYAESQLAVVSSLLEGGCRVVGEAIVAGTPVIGSRVDGVLGLLDDAYPGTFPAGDTTALRHLLHRCEVEADFRDELRRRTLALAPRFDGENEKNAWSALLKECEERMLSGSR